MQAEATEVITTPHTGPQSGAERRRYPRLVFSPKDGVTAGLRFSMPQGVDLCVQAMVMNLSRGGLGMGIPRDELGGAALTEGQRFTIGELRVAYRQARLVLDIEAQIRWTVDADYIAHVCFGCAFESPDDLLRQQLADFVAANFPHLELA